MISISPSSITIVIPVKDNLGGMTRLLNRLEQVGEFPREVIVVDNESLHPLKAERLRMQYGRDLKVLRCSRPGPAAARNVGWREAATPWVLFLDSDCLPEPGFLREYCRSRPGVVAYQGAVRSHGRHLLGDYYESKQTLLPPSDGAGAPLYLVTANCLVSREALHSIAGFDESFRIAGGEDIDLGFRLRRLGKIAYENRAAVSHDFKDSPLDFYRRFFRYGYGNRLVAEKYKLDLRPRLSVTNEGRLARVLSWLQFVAMTIGYEFAVQGLPCPIFSRLRQL